MGTVNDDDPILDWGAAPGATTPQATVVEPARDADTAPHDLTQLAAALKFDVRDQALRDAYTEGQEDVIRRLYEVMRKHQLTTAEMDNIVLDVRGGLLRL